ncbi:hypothetical protein [Thorsellia kenyensis]|uniref:Uncharacterized protein n=1 Tax=Thorsellia kenyensis TaxID=1549888 RepID=A0ABV6C9G6_9GAMM
MYQAALLMHPERWKERNTRNWDRINIVILNPVKSHNLTHEKNTHLLDKKGKVA